jgi:hypothetical protein
MEPLGRRILYLRIATASIPQASFTWERAWVALTGLRTNRGKTSSRDCLVLYRPNGGPIPEITTTST